MVRGKDSGQDGVKGVIEGGRKTPLLEQKMREKRGTRLFSRPPFYPLLAPSYANDESTEARTVPCEPRVEALHQLASQNRRVTLR